MVAISWFSKNFKKNQGTMAVTVLQQFFFRESLKSHIISNAKTLRDEKKAEKAPEKRNRKINTFHNKLSWQGKDGTPDIKTRSQV